MYGRAGLDRFKKAQSLEPFSVTLNSAPKTATQPASEALIHPSAESQNSHQKTQHHVSQKPLVADVPTQLISQLGGVQSTWQPPDWAIEPWPGVYYLEVLKDGEVLDRINLDKRRHIFGRQFHTCDFVLDHQSVSRQHAAVIPHKNGSIYVIDLGSAHGTFVANERLAKDSPVELELGQSLRFAASTRTYILRKNNAALFPPTPLPTEITLPPSPDPSDEEAVLSYNTFLNRYDGVDVGTKPSPVGVKEGSLVGKYESLVQITVIPKGTEQSSVKEHNVSQKGVTDKLQEVLNKVKNPPKSGIYDDLYGESFSGKVGSSWAYSSVSSGGRQASPTKDAEVKEAEDAFSGKIWK
ncbi:SMAD/FHA domain-containing protein [Actinidia rufa]|uniref:SMAD/FHA domain-containing protein n=1 Tax=Actinidia rufa TaxID=165716 RepID=A0A7J0FXD5_9ERIC|nr:SMAD/FHA domain-containing protein [Actinidia rufa]